jgi:transcriptional regulator with XRE-family HTH domain
LPNERLRAALLEHGLTPAKLADELGVDAKTVERWITAGRLPYRKTRYQVAARLKTDETFLWPDALSQEQVAAAAESEIVTVYPHRWAVPNEVWRRFYEGAEQDIGVLVYSGLFLAESTGLLPLFARKARAGVGVRILLGDPDSAEVAQHGAEIGLGEAMAARIRNALVVFEPLRRVDNVEIRLHRTVLYNSVYIADTQVLVNSQIYGVPAQNAPVMHLRRVAGGDMVSTYLESFERVWAGATPVQ